MLNSIHVPRGLCFRPRQQQARRCLVARSAVAAAPQSLQQLTKSISLDRAALAPSIEDGREVLVASADVGAGQTLFSVDQAQWITTETVQRSPLGKALTGVALEPWCAIALLLIHERSTGYKGEAGAYAASLPYQPSAAPGELVSPLFWSEDELQTLLGGTQVGEQALAYRVFFRNTFEQLQQGLFASSPALFPPQAFTLEAFMWAAAAVRSRLRPPLDGAKIALVPLADAVSHRRSPSTTWRLKAAGLFGKGQALAVEAVRPVRKGEALSMDYGPGRLDGPVLLDYGVLDADTPQAGYSLALTLPDTDRCFDDKADVLELAGLQQTEVFALSPGSGQPSETMLAFMRLLNLGGGDAFLLESVFRDSVWDHMQQPVSEENERTVCTTLLEGARAALSRYPGDVAGDAAQLRSLPRGSRQAVAIMVRSGERNALDALALWCEERITDIKRLEFYQERRLKRLGLLDDQGRTTYDGFFKDGIA